MITYIFGKTGSGKSFRAVKMMIEKTKDMPVRSSINLIKHLAGYTYLDPSMMAKMFKDIEEIYLVGTNQMKGEEWIYDELRKKNIANFALFIDEAHIYGFGDTKKKDFLMFFLSLQRHVGLDIYLITQTPDQFNRIFHGLGDVIISCISPTERALPNVFEYQYFSHVKYFGKSDQTYRNEKLKADPKIFEYYKSGDKNYGDNSFRKKLYYLIGGTVLAALFALYQFSSLFNTKPKESPSKKTQNNEFSSNQTILDLNDTYSLVYCSGNYCSVNDFLLPRKDFLNFIATHQKKSMKIRIYGDVIKLKAKQEYVAMFLDDNSYDNPMYTWFDFNIKD